MKQLVVILFFLSIAGCSFNISTKEAASASSKAVYFYQKESQLSLEDLQAHPEVIVVQTFEELKKNANQKIALWIDESATPVNLEQEAWINAEPQAYYPIALIGTSDTLRAFRDLLSLRCFFAVSYNYPSDDTPGFSIVQREPRAAPTGGPMDVIFVKGYNQKPTVQSVLETTNSLLEGKVKPTPIAILPKPVKQFGTSTTRQVLLYDEWPCSSFPDDAAKINTVMVEKNTLKINVTYQGGCQEHTFELYAATAFLQSIPPQALLHLSHDSHGDTCTKNMEKQLSFDLTPLEKERDEPGGHPLLLRIYEPIGGGSFATEPYMPLIEWP
jgi:hypothetical protein